MNLRISDQKVFGSTIDTSLWRAPWIVTNRFGVGIASNTAASEGIFRATVEPARASWRSAFESESARRDPCNAAAAEISREIARRGHGGHQDDAGQIAIRGGLDRHRAAERDTAQNDSILREAELPCCVAQRGFSIAIYALLPWPTRARTLAAATDRDRSPHARRSNRGLPCVPEPG